MMKKGEGSMHDASQQQDVDYAAAGGKRQRQLSKTVSSLPYPILMLRLNMQKV